MDLAQSPGASNVLERTDGIIPVDKGKNVHSPILDISEVSKSPTNQWTPPNTISITPLSINLGSTIPYTKPYFVTEPDSPKSHHTKPNSPSNFAIQTKYPNKSPPYSPTPTSHDTPPSPPLSPKTLSKNQFMDISLASVLTSLNIKRKASEEGEDERGSKLLRLCAPDTGTGLDSQCTKTPSTSSKRKPKGPTKKAAGRGSSGAANSRYSATICDTPLVNSDEYNLCDVPIVVENPRIGHTLTSQALGDMVRRNRPSIVFLMETKNNKVKLETIRRRLNFDFSSYVDPEGLAGGIALWWNKDISVDVEFANKNLVHTVLSDNADSSCWAATFVYGCPSYAGKEKVWNELREIANSEILPWLCIGDFNQVLNAGDKFGGNTPDQGRIRAFHDMLNDCGLVDLECKGPRFTWRNKRTDGELIMERIDLAFANTEWREKFDTALVFVELAVGSDHNPLLLNTNVSPNKVRKPFRFESLWTTEEDCNRIVSDS
ncbi:hypothetical protein RHGRI_025530 [Rhododendron griersonianum]|uniref:Endonuclease/exonuclease/phosphatase domain-containing protein n=1 Tax=Rhododendron griersonianum TaxID=479676 RepID=A0AAV6IQR5_9ERIC|nr:hypothetical protein RHGRI_025530 [Rhododendron griersonianum]